MTEPQRISEHEGLVKLEAERDKLQAELSVTQNGARYMGILIAENEKLLRKAAGDWYDFEKTIKLAKSAQETFGGSTPVLTKWLNRMAAAERERDELRAIVNKLRAMMPKAADGVAVKVGMWVCWFNRKDCLLSGKVTMVKQWNGGHSIKVGQQGRSWRVKSGQLYSTRPENIKLCLTRRGREMAKRIRAEDPELAAEVKRIVAAEAAQ